LFRFAIVVAPSLIGGIGSRGVENSGGFAGAALQDREGGLADVTRAHAMQ
jgi:hypothetical protein